jgi:hypothetical protein
MVFQIREASSFFSKHLKQNTTILEFDIKLFSHCFVTFEDQRDIVDS